MPSHYGSVHNQAATRKGTSRCEHSDGWLVDLAVLRLQVFQQLYFETIKVVGKGFMQLFEVVGFEGKLFVRLGY